MFIKSYRGNVTGYIMYYLTGFFSALKMSQAKAAMLGCGAGILGAGLASNWEAALK